MENKGKKRSPLGERIEQRLKELGKGQSFLQDKLGVTQSAVSQWLSGASNPKKLNKLAAALETTIEWLETGVQEPSAQKSNNNSTNSPYSRQGNQDNVTSIRNQKIPVYGPAGAGSPERIILTEEYIVEYDDMPDSLLGVKDAFKIIVAGDSMEPRYYAGEKADIHPYKKPSIGQDCVLVDKEDGNAIIKRYMGETTTEYKVAQYNPAKAFSIKKSKIRSIYTVLGRSQ